MKQTILDHINNGTFPEWHIEAQENNEITKGDLRDIMDQLVALEQAPKYTHSYISNHIIIHFL